MSLASKLFAVYGFGLLVLAFSCPYILPGVEVSIPIGNKGYGFPLASVCIGLAALYCVFAAVYSLYMLPFSKTGELWHFVITALGTSLALASFYRFALEAPILGQRGTDLSGLDLVVAWVVIASPILVLLAQSIFVFNLIYAAAKKR